MLLLTPIAVSFAAGLLNIYPFWNRAVIYLLPLGLMIIAEGILVALSYIVKFSKVGTVLFVILLMGKPVSLFVGTFIRHPDGSREAVQFIVDNIQPDDTVTVGRYAEPHFKFYSLGKDIPYQVVSVSHPILLPSDVFGETNNKIGFRKYLSDLAELVRDKNRVWFYLNDSTLKEKECIFSFLSDKGNLQLRYSNKNAYVFMYEPL